MTKRFDWKKKSLYKKHRTINKKGHKLRKYSAEILVYREHVFNVKSDELSDDEHILLTKGLYFIPTPIIRISENLLTRDCNEFARKLKCKV